MVGISCGIIAFLVAELFDNTFRVGMCLPYLIFTEGALLVTVKNIRSRERARAREESLAAASSPAGGLP